MNLTNLLSEQLQQFHFPGFPSLSKPRVAGKTRLLSTRMADLTPLSISQPLGKKTKKTLCDQDSYEAKIKKGGFKPDDSLRHDFGSEYRDIGAASLSPLHNANEGKKLPKYPAAPLPFLANKSSENTNMDLPSPSFYPTTAEAALLAENPLASQYQGHARQKLNLGTPTSTTAETFSSAPSLTQFTKEQLANITNNTDYRTAGRDACSSNQKEDADELATESDLETHAGDDDFNYAVDPEGEGYDSLQSQFENVRIRKRNRDAVEDAEDAEDDNEQEAGAGHLDGVGKHMNLRLPLTEEERAHRGKKLRTAGKNSAEDGGKGARGELL